MTTCGMAVDPGDAGIGLPKIWSGNDINIDVTLQSFCLLRVFVHIILRYNAVSASYNAIHRVLIVEG